MSRLVVVTTPDLAPGYRLAGATTVEVASATQAARAVEELTTSENGVIAVHEPYLHGLDRRLRARLDALQRPLVVPLPAGRGGGGATERRERLLQMLMLAVGYEITFDNDGCTA